MQEGQTKQSTTISLEFHRSRCRQIDLLPHFYISELHSRRLLVPLAALHHLHNGVQLLVRRVWLRSLAGGVVVSEGSGIFDVPSLQQAVPASALRGGIPTVRLLPGMQAD